MTAIRANMVGPPDVATRISASRPQILAALPGRAQPV